MEYIIVAAIVILSLALTVGWVILLIDAARAQKWGWFVVMLIFSVAAIPYYFMEYGRGSAAGRG